MARSSGAIATGTTRRADPVEVESLEPLKVLIWAKTYPELSKRHRETVCTGGCLEDGTPIRLYPVPLRYLPVTSQYRLYDWISVPLRRNSMDTRPESFRVAQGVMPTTVGKARTTHGWEARREVVFKRQDWHFDCASDLHAESIPKLVETRVTSGRSGCGMSLAIGMDDPEFFLNRGTERREVAIAE